MKKFTTNFYNKFIFIVIILVTSYIICREIYHHIKEQKIQNSIKIVPVKRFKKVNDVTFKDIVKAEQQSPDLIAYIKNKVILPPSGKPYNLSDSNVVDTSQFQQGSFLREYFKGKKFGTFIEAGAYDGEHLSNTLILERQLGWTGLLIEPNPNNFALLSTKHRKAHYTNSCIALTTTPNTLEISYLGTGSQIIDTSNEKNKMASAKVNCFPLYSMMAAVNITTVDLISLDVESFEVKMLKTIPWDEVDIKTLLIEVNHIPEGKEFLKKFMSERNYTLKKIFPIDFFFVKNS